MKEVKCPVCCREKEIKDNIVMCLCPICQEEMEEFVNKYEKN